MIYTPSFLCDLHCHTKRSDGNDEPWELIDEASRLGIRILAITDHDIAPPRSVIKDGKEIDILEYARNADIDLIKGIEISCDTNVEDVHILAFGCNWDDSFFKEMEASIVESKVNSYKELTDRLIRNNIDVSWSEILYNKGIPLKDSEVQKKHIFEMIAQKGYTNNWQESKMMVKRNPAYNIKREKPDSLRIIDKIHQLGGLAILAHPYLIDDKINSTFKNVNSRDQYIDHLIERGLDGIEACYSYDKTSYPGNMSNEEIYTKIIEAYSNRVRIISGGSDYHADHKKGIPNARKIGECGITPEDFYNNVLLSSLSGEYTK